MTTRTEGEQLALGGALIRQSTAARILGLPSLSVKRLMDAGQIRYGQVGHKRMPLRDDVLALCEDPDAAEQRLRPATGVIVLTDLERRLLAYIAESGETTTPALYGQDSTDKVRPALSRLDVRELIMAGKGRTWTITDAGRRVLTDS